ncbi:DUF4446 family protein [Nocardioides sp. B-3]|uniref:DUF4446 family protein n=1 Tax=Nocardioides sp. B-3 TaxID=2895565 RepID=UPI0021530E97|nr:DUF4446 family protein [Nocardioides sp. B-3]UUZ60987.1 DUF4446 family protein [Nocardioides sp. B-3]
MAALKAEAVDSLRHLSVVRYDAFGDVGGHLSWSIALLDDAGHGVVLTSIHGRSEARTYAKSITGWTCEQQLSPEEDEAIAARVRDPGAGRRRYPPVTECPGSGRWSGPVGNALPTTPARTPESADLVSTSLPRGTGLHEAGVSSKTGISRVVRRAYFA